MPAMSLLSRVAKVAKKKQILKINMLIYICINVQEGCSAIPHKQRLPEWKAFVLKWSQLSGSNRRPDDYKSTALPTELSWRFKNYFLDKIFIHAPWQAFSILLSHYIKNSSQNCAIYTSAPANTLEILQNFLFLFSTTSISPKKSFAAIQRQSRN